MLFEFDSFNEQRAKIRVVGVGGAGGNAINRMINSQLSGVEFIAINTDAQALENNNADMKLQIGLQITKGLGAGANLEVGEKAAVEDYQAITASLEGSDMVFITAGMGGGTGTGAAPIVAKIAKELGALTIGVVTSPFRFEGRPRTNRANVGIEKLKKSVDTLIVIPNQRLLSIVEKGTSMADTFNEADSILHQATKGIADVININGLINLDFADVKTTMSNMGDAVMGTGVATGDERAVLAAQTAISSPLLSETNIRGARGLLVNITGGEDLSMHDVDEAMTVIFDEVGEDANIIFGAVINPELNGEMHVTVIATGFGEPNDDSDFSLATDKETETSPEIEPENNIGLDDMEPEIIFPPSHPSKERYSASSTNETRQNQSPEISFNDDEDFSTPAYDRKKPRYTFK
jgi:cell division protein FtsZ